MYTERLVQCNNTVDSAKKIHASPADLDFKLTSAAKFYLN